MRSTSGPCWDAWTSGNFTGPDAKPHGRITVDQHWNLNEYFSGADVGSYPTQKLPVRWFARADEAPDETEVPNVKSIRISRSIDQDSATCTVTIYNQQMVTPTTTTEIGQPGYYTPTRGTSGNPWGHTANAWDGVLVPNTMIRSYQGVGGYNADGTQKSIATCLASGNLIQTGTWLVDEVRVSTDGTLTLTCRDLAKLLIDQFIYPPLIPKTVYPLSYQRFGTWTVDTPQLNYGSHVTGAKLVAGIEPAGVYIDPHGQRDLGYWILGDDGGVFAYGFSHFYGANVSNPPHTVVGIAAPQAKDGYWTLTNDGTVYNFGAAAALGQPGPGLYLYTDITAPQSADGYYVCNSIGQVFNYTAVHHGDSPASSYAIVAMASMPNGSGYWLLNSNGNVYAYGAAVHYGEGAIGAIDIASAPDGLGYYIVTQGGTVYAYGSATFLGDAHTLTLSDPIAGIGVAPDGSGYWLVAQDGGIFSYGATFYGSLPAAHEEVFSTDGNYTDLTNVVEDLLLWAGFFYFKAPLVGGLPAVYANLDMTGTYSDDVITGDIFDKRPVIDAITKIREAVGMYFWVDETGRPTMALPNWWGPGNYLPDGTHTTFIPDVSDAQVITGYTARTSDNTVRSNIIVTSEEPTASDTGTVMASIIPPDGGMLHGMTKMSMYVNPIMNNYNDMYAMDELIGMQMAFQMRLGSLTCVGNPALSLDDQIRIYERQSEEIFVHYIRGIDSNMDLDKGTYTMTITTHFLSDPADWTITAPGSPVPPDIP